MDHYRSPLQDAYDDAYEQPHPHRLQGNYNPSIHSRNQIRRYHPYHEAPGSNLSSQHSVQQQNRYTDRHKSASYPKELTAMFGALECKLCAIELSSPIVAKMHYSGKPHMKKIKMFMTDWSEKTGLPILENSSTTNNLAILESSKNNLVHGNGFGSYCEVCDVSTKSISDQVLHYSGKTHKKNMLDPANAKKKKKTYETIDLSGRFGIGQDFSSEVPEIKFSNTEEEKTQFVCDLCDVTALTQDQLNQHLSGKKHKEKAMKKELNIPKRDKPYSCALCNVALDTKALYQLHLQGKKHAKNIMKRKIESQGVDKCEICDISFTSLDHYQTHISGRRHERQVLLQRFSKPLDQKPTLTCQFCPFVGNIENHICDKSLMKMDFENLENKWVCTPCHNMVFESEKEYNEHKNSSRHILCVLNQEKGDPINEDLKHLYCYLCRNQYLDYKEYTEHLLKEKHMKLSQEQGNLDRTLQLFRCTVCDLTLIEDLKEQHMRSRQHIRESLKTDTMLTLTNLAHKDLTTMAFHCEHCDVGPLTFIEYSQHVLGEAHINIMIDAKQMSLMSF